jgi:hypothetical protein
VYAYGYTGGYAVFVRSGDGDASVTTTDTSDIEAQGVYGAFGVDISAYGNATVTNAGDIYAYAGGVVGNSFQAIGVTANSDDGDATVTNSGYVGAVTYGETYGSQSATGIRAIENDIGGGAATINNSGTVVASATGFGYGGLYATGADAYSYDYNATIDN